MNKVDKYIFSQIFKGFVLILFIFLSISWLLQFTRLISLTNLIQVDIFTIFYLSTFLIPNLVSIIIPFVIMFGLVITFLKLHKDKEIISIYSLGLKTNSIIKSMILFSIIIIIILLSFNFYFAPQIYKEYKVKEYDIRNKIDFEKISISNFIEIQDNTFLDFKKDGQKFKEVFIKFSEDSNDNLIYAEEAEISQNKEKFIFKLINGFKITFLEINKIEKLEFTKYNLEIQNSTFKQYNNLDKNTLNIYDDLINKDYLNIAHKSTDAIIVILIVLFFYFNNIKFYNFNFSRLFIYFLFSSTLLILNQVIKNLEINFLLYIIIIFLILLTSLFYFFIGKKNA